MKKRVFKVFTAVSAIGIAASLASCTGDKQVTSTKESPSTSASTSTSTKTTDKVTDSEVFYSSNSNGEYIFTKIGDKFTLSIDGKTFTGAVTVNNNDLALNATGLTNCTAKYVDGQLIFTYNTHTYIFYKMVYYTVSFNNGANTTTCTVLNGTSVEAPDTSSEDGKVFVGWYKDQAYTEVYEFKKEVVTSDLTLYARYVDLEVGTREYNVSFYNGSDLEYAKTVNGMIYSLPTPESSNGNAFLGWWVSDFNDPNKLTYKYTNQKLSADTALYAVWNDGNLHPEVNENGLSWNSLGTGKTYSVTVTDPNGKSESFSSQALEYKYNFEKKAKGVYKLEVSCDGKSGTVYYSNKALAMVSNYCVPVDGLLVFSPVEHATHYKITVECGDDEHNHYEYDLGSNTYFDFSNCPMTDEGITFKVTAFADGYQKSEETTFNYLLSLDEVKNLTVEDDELKWDSVDNANGYVVEVTIGDDVISFDVGNQTSFSLHEFTGDMKLSVYPVTVGYASKKSKEIEYKKDLLASPQNIDVKNMTVTWDPVAGAKSYVLKFGDIEYQTEAASYDVTLEMLEDGVTKYNVSVKAIADDSSKNSYFSNEVEFNYLELMDLKYGDGLLEWSPVLGATSFGVVVNDGEEVSVKNVSYYNLEFTQAGKNTIKVCFYNSKGTKSNWVELDVYTYAVYFEALNDNTKDVETKYYAFGDTLDLPEAEYSGYEFAGWYNIPGGSLNNGVEVKNNSNMPAHTLVLFASYTPKKYDVTLVCGDDASLEEDTVNVGYKQKFELPVPSRDSQDLVFEGWYTDVSGNGTKITDGNGVSISTWEYKSDMTLYANWVNVLNYEEVTSNGKVTGYKAVPGVGMKNVTEVTVPATYNGKNVVELGSFAGYSKIVKLNIPNTISYIDTVTGFTSCSSLKAVNVYDVEGYKGDVYYTSYDGVLYYNNEISVNSGWEVRFVPAGKDGHCEIMTGTVNIPVKAFYSSNITSVTIPYTVNTIGVSAFRYCYDLVSVEFEATPEGEDEVGLTLAENSFASCSHLVSITLPKRTQSISTGYADYSNLNPFSYCYKLEEINVEEGCKYFSSIGGILYTANKDKVILAPEGISGEVKINTGTLKIGAYSFRSCDMITKVVIPGSVLEIEEQAFKYCYKLTEIEFADENETTLTIRTEAFYGCDLTYVELPRNARVIETSAFGYNDNLTTVKVNSDNNEGTEALKFADGITQDSASYSSRYSYVTTVIIGKNAAEFDVGGAFGGSNNSLAKIEVEEGNQYYYSDSEGVLYNSQKTKIIFYPALKATMFTIPSTVEEIASGCFRNRTALVSFNIGKNIKKIGDNAFDGCTNLNSLTFDNDRTEDLEIGASAFNKCSSLVSVTLPAHTTKLGDKAFRYCEGLTSITLPDELEEIGSNAFYSCKSLVSITIPKSVNKLGANNGTNNELIDCFEACENLASFIVANDNASFASYDGVIYGKEDGVARTLIFASSALSGDIVIPKTVNYIVSNAFYANSKITNVAFEDGKSAVSVVNGVETEGTLTIGSKVFYECSNLVSVQLPNLTSIPDETFSGCTNLTNFEVPNTVASIGQRAFANCSNFVNLTFEEGNDSNSLIIADGNYYWYAAFYGCKVENLVLPKRLTYVGDYAFGYSKIQTVIFPAGLSYLGTSAFEDCYELESVTFDANCKLTELKSYTFSGSSLKSIVLPDSITTIAKGCFSKTNLVEFKAPKALTSIPDSCFASCSYLENVDLSDSKVTAISNSAFSYCKNLKAINIPSIVNSIGDSAFNSCLSLESITFGEKSKLLSIGDSAFAGTGLSSFNFPTVYNDSTDSNKATSLNLGINLFSGCKSLTSVYLSESVDSVSGVFAGCNSIENITLDSNNQYFSMDNGMPILYNKSKDAIRYVFGTVLSGEYKIPNTIKTVSSYAFEGQKKITKVVVPASVVDFGDYVFSNCEALTSVEFDSSSSLTKLGNGTFYNSTSLENVVLPIGLKEIGDNAFSNCSSLYSITADKVETVGKSAFYGCSSLVSASLDSVTSLGGSAFYNCYALESFKLTKDLELGTSVFSGCKGLSSVEIEEGVTALPNNTFNNCSSLKSVVLPESLELIGNYCFNKAGLESIVIPEATLTIGYNAFDENKSLLSVQINAPIVEFDSSIFSGCSSLETVEFVEGVEFIGYNMFYGCSSLKNVTLPNSLVGIGSYAFQGTGLESITIPENVSEIGTYYYGGTVNEWSYTYVFADCPNLSEVNIESKVLKCIGVYTFKNTPNLKTITLSSSVETIYANAFTNSGLEEINISSVTTLGKGVFKDCKNLTAVYLSQALEKIPTETFSGCTSLVDVTLPTAVTELGDYAFENTGVKDVKLDNISKFGSSVFDGCKDLESFKATSNDLTEIPNGMFAGCSKLTTLELSDSLVEIGANAFSETAIVSFVLPKNLEKIGKSAFYNCTNLRGIDFTNNDSIVSVGESAFEGCTLLSAITLPDTLEEIGNYAFKNSGLTGTFNIGANVKKIGNNPFVGCEGITDIIVDSANKYYMTDNQKSLYTVNKELISCNSTIVGEYVVPSDVTVLGYAFSNCKYITKISFADGSTEIGSYALALMPSVVEVELPESLTKIGDYAFAESLALKTAKLYGNIEYGKYVFSNSKVEKAEISTELESVSVGTFYGCDALVEVEFFGDKNNFVKIEESAFEKCTALKTFVFPKSITTLENKVFKGSGFESVSIPKSIVDFGDYVFSECPNLTTFEFEDGCTVMGDYMFNQCPQLSNVIIPESLTVIANSAFAGCSNLKTIKLPETLTKIDYYAFYNSGLETISIPASTEEIGGQVFRDCLSLRNVTFEGNIKKLGYDAFWNCTSIMSIVIPGDGLESLGSYLFEGWIKEQTVYFTISEEQVSQISGSLMYLFYGCDAKVVYNYNPNK